MYVGTIASVLLACLVCQATSQIEPSARNMAPHDVKVTFPDHACDHQFREGSFKATVSWESPRMNRPIRAYVVHVLTPTGVDITIHVDVTMTRQELNFLQCWSAYVIRVEALYESGDSAFSDALFFTTGKQNSKVLPQDLRADNIGYSCINGASTGSVKLSWKPAEVDSFNITGYTVIVTPQEFQSKIFTLDKDAKSFQYDDASCEGTTFFSVHARALVRFGIFGATPSEIALPDAYAVFSPKSKAYVVPASTTTESSTTVTEGHTTASETVSSAAPEHDSTTTGHIVTTEESHEATTHFNDVEPAASGLSTSNILCIVLIPLAVILLAALLFFGYKKYKKGGSSLLGDSDSP